jgi:Domain of unknown function DUF29
MAKTLSRPADLTLYDEDFYVWTQRQAELLRKGEFPKLDLPHLIEEVEDLGKSQQREVFSRTQQIIRHLLKLHFSASTDARRSWRQTVGEQRDEIELVLTPSLRRELETALATRYERARRTALRDLADHGERRVDVPGACPYSVNQVLDPDWLPKNIHGIQDRAS